MSIEKNQDTKDREKIAELRSSGSKKFLEFENSIGGPSELDMYVFLVGIFEFDNKPIVEKEVPWLPTFDASHKLPVYKKGDQSRTGVRRDLNTKHAIPIILPDDVDALKNIHYIIYYDPTGVPKLLSKFEIVEGKGYSEGKRCVVAQVKSIFSVPNDPTNPHIYENFVSKCRGEESNLHIR